MDQDDVVARFTYHAPADDAQIERHKLVRQNALALALILLGHVPQGREQALAMRHLEEAVFWPNAGIARNQPPATAVAPAPVAARQEISCTCATTERSWQPTVQTPASAFGFRASGR